MGMREPKNVHIDRSLCSCLGVCVRVFVCEREGRIMSTSQNAANPTQQCV